jgi:hypothetical protein
MRGNYLENGFLCEKRWRNNARSIRPSRVWSSCLWSIGKWGLFCWKGTCAVLHTIRMTHRNLDFYGMTRLDEFLPFGWLLTFGDLFSKLKVSKTFMLLFQSQKVICILFYCALSYILADFYRNNTVTLQNG